MQKVTELRKDEPGCWLLSLLFSDSLLGSVCKFPLLDKTLKLTFPNRYSILDDLIFFCNLNQYDPCQKHQLKIMALRLK